MKCCDLPVAREIEKEKYRRGRLGVWTCGVECSDVSVARARGRERYWRGGLGVLDVW